MKMNPFLKQFLRSSRRMMRSADLTAATAQIQRTLRAMPGAAPAPAARAPARPAPTVVEAFVVDRDGTVSPPASRAGARAEAKSDAKSEPAPAARFGDGTFTSDFGTRAYKLYEPARRAGEAPGLVVMLHGCTQNPDDFAAGTRMNECAGALGLAVLYPAQAARSNAHKCWNWFVRGDQKRGAGEPALIAAMVRQLVASHGFDASRVFVAGLSAGGAMAAILAREYADVFAAGGVHSGLKPGAAHDVTSALAVMRSGRGDATPPAAAGAAPGAPLIVFHGDADGTVATGNGAELVTSVLGGVAFEATRELGKAGRSYTRTVYQTSGAGADTPAGVSASTASTASTAAPTPARVEHWLVHGAGHAWSGGDRAGSYTDPAGPDASKEMLRFFTEHAPAPRRQAPAAEPEPAL